jgi:tetratricopeptide (TPR) repeat protein
MAPEQLRGEKVDGRADQFSWGTMAYEIVSGALPWGGVQGAYLVAAILANPVRPLAEVAPGVAPQLAAAIERTLEKKRDDRFATMEELIQAIDGTNRSSRVVVSSSEPAVPTAKTELGATATPPRPEPKRARRSGLAAAIGIGALVLVGGGQKGDPLLMQISHREQQLGLITRDELRARREAWRKARVAPDAREESAYFLWREMYARHVVTAEDAREALANFAEAGAIPPDDKNIPSDQLWIGRAYALAGDYATALPYLRYATRACSREIGWIDRMRAFVLLGDALAQTGDVAGAREAYQKVVDAWGSAVPRSLTAAKARARLAALPR